MRSTAGRALDVLDARWRYRLVALVAVGPCVVLATWPDPVDRVWFGCAALVVALLLAQWLATRDARPLERLGDEVDRLAEGRPGALGVVGGGPELVRLAARFDRLAAAIETRERELVASRDQLRAIADSIPGQVVYIDADERYRYVNAYRSDTPDRIADDIIGRTVREVRGDRTYALAAPELQQDYQEHWQGFTRRFHEES